MANKTLLYHSGMAGMPSTNLATAGGLTALLDACLVDGLNPTTATGVTRSGSTATFALAGAVNFAIGEIVESAGWDQPEYNGRFKAIAKTTNSVSVTVSGSPATPGTGTSMTLKHPAAGWTKSVFATNAVGYTAGAGSQGLSLQVEDNNPLGDASRSRVRMAQGLTGLDTAALLGNQHTIAKAGGPWTLVADARTCYIVMNYGNVLHFGEFASFVAGDAFPWFVTRGETGENGSSPSPGYYGFTVSGRTFPQWVWMPGMNDGYIRPGLALLRGASQTGGPVLAHCLETADIPGNNGSIVCRRWQEIAAPNGADGSVPLVPMYVNETSPNNVLRGQFRGMMWPLCRQPDEAFAAANVCRLDDVVINGAVRSAAVMRFGVNATSQIAFDLGDWA